MHSEPKVLLKQAIQRCLPILQSLVGRFSTPCLVWKNTGEGQWNGAWVSHPDLAQIFAAADKEICHAGAAFGESFLEHHKEFNGMVGCPRFGWFNFGAYRTYIVRSSLGHLWDRFESFDLGEDLVDGLVKEVEAFVDAPLVRLQFRARLLNFRSHVASIDLPEGLRIRRLTESEFSSMHGGTMYNRHSVRNNTLGLHEFCIEGVTEEPKMHGDPKEEEPPASDQVREKLDRSMLCLRTFKAGKVGYDQVDYFPVAFCPLIFGSRFYGDLYVPLGTYEIKAHEIAPLVYHAKLVFGVSDDAMAMACSRLADAELRTRPQDCIVDAVIGMEALLLAGMDDRRSELSFRFALNYSMLHPTDERKKAYRVARDLYGLRSKVAHGSSIDGEKLKIADQKVSLDGASTMATESLRFIMMFFLAKKGSPHKNHDFWQRAYFGLPEEL